MVPYRGGPAARSASGVRHCGRQSHWCKLAVGGPVGVSSVCRCSPCVGAVRNGWLLAVGPGNPADTGNTSGECLVAPEWIWLLTIVGDGLARTQPMTGTEQRLEMHNGPANVNVLSMPSSQEGYEREHAAHAAVLPAR